MFYHANWGNSLRELHRVHPDVRFLKDAYEGLLHYARWLDRERDPEGSGLCDIHNHYETGQEYMHRYIAVDPRADRDNWGKIFRLKGVDATVYLYELKKTLAWAAAKIHRRETEIARLRRSAEQVRSAILEKMWDPKTEMFYDVDSSTGKRTRVKAAVCFYPYMTDIVSPSHLNGFEKHLLNPREFWTPFPVPSSSADDPYFSADAVWKGRRMNCPWNGRVWPMTNSHIAEALALCAIRFGSDRLKSASVEFIGKFVRMMFSDNDPRRPNCFEHYHPLTGEPSLYRGIDDYQHSWVNDLLLKYVCGVRPIDGKVVVDPFPFPMHYVHVKGCIVQGHEFRVEREGNRFQVWMDGKRCSESVVGTPVVIEVGSPQG